MNNIIIFLLFLLCFNSGYAQVVTEVSQGKVFIDDSADELKTGYYYFSALNGKNRGLLKVFNSGKGEAQAHLLRGESKQGDTVVLRTKGINLVQDSLAESTDEGNYEIESEENLALLDPIQTLNTSYSGGYSKIQMGGMFHLTNDSASATDPDGDTADLSGSNFGLGYFIDYNLNKNFGGRGHFSYTSYEAEASGDTNSACGTAKCLYSVQYFDVGGTLKYYLTKGAFKLWPGFGVNIFIPYNQDDTNVINNDIGINIAANIKMGFDYHFNNKYFIPFDIGYLFFPSSSENFELSRIQANLGFGYKFGQSKP